jgi:arylsulfatase A-like enzyme
LAAIVVMAAGCAAELEEGPLPVDGLVPRVRLADVAARDEGWREPAAATIGDTTRYVLGASDVVPLEVRTPEAGPRSDGAGRLVVEIRCPSEPPGPHHVVVELVRLALIPQRVERRLGPACADEGAEWRPVPFDGLAPDAIFAAVASLMAPPPSLVSPVVDVPAGAELRVAVGVRAEGTPPAGSYDVEVAAVTPDAGRRTLGRRTVRARDVAPPGRWIEWRVPLDDARRSLGPTMSFAFDATSRTGPDGLLHVLWGDATVWGPRRGERAGHERSVVLVSLDTLRADRLGAAGYPLDVTPNLDRLAREGTMFTDVVSSANWTMPAHATMLTGTHPCVHGADWGGEAGGPLPAGIVPIAERLREAGWATAAFTEDAYVSAAVFHRGFDVFVADVESHVSGAVEKTVAAATAWIEANAKRPFFVLVHTYQVHHPYVPPPEYAGLAAMTDVPSLPGLPPPSRDLMDDAAAYVAEVAYTDAVVGRLLGRIDALGLGDDTIVVVTSDHGEAFGEHGRRAHGTGLHEEQMRVPLIVRAPGLVAAGRRVGDMVGLVDLTPTLLDLLGFERQPWMQGVSLARAMRPEGAEQVLLGRVLPIRGFGSLAGIRGATWKLKLGKRPRYWDLKADPGEMHPRSVSERTMAVLPNVIDSTCRRGRALVEQAGAGRRTGRTPQRSAEERLKLRALGYVE